MAFQSPAWLTRRVANLIGFLSCCALMGYALYAQYVELLEPCPLCTFQRIAVIGVGVVFLLAALQNPKSTGARVYSLLIVVFALAGVGVAARHIWVQAQPPGSVQSCGAGIGYLMDIMPLFDVIKKVLMGSGECQHIDKILGISWPWWTAAALTIHGAWAALTNWKLTK